ncbi:type II toxin-antitoxin system RelE/ParE family toxin [Pseudomonas aeruginosa]|nr:type II toxin-antitoxin system RelE/ParE family toxin [Pseudomonas aeruginosa]
MLWTVDAEQDRERIYDYLDERNPIAAIELDDLIREKVSLLAHNNLMGRTGQKKGTRELVVHPHYVVVYDITENVRILRVLHTSQQISVEQPSPPFVRVKAEDSPSAGHSAEGCLRESGGF